MILSAALFLAAVLGPLDEAEAALVAGRIEQASKMVQQLASEGVSGPRFERLRAGQALAAGRDSEALARFGNLAYRPDSRASDREGAAIAAYRLGKKSDARQWTAQAMAMRGASWRAFNLCGVLADEAADFARAEDCYAKADALSPGRSEVANNRGWSRLLRGDWAGAATGFAAALAIDPGDRVARSNLDLARAALANDLPSRSESESDADYGRRLNDAGVMAAAAGQRERALAAFASSIDIRPTWSAIAAQNLEDVQRR